MENKISIIMPVYNRAKYVKETIKSIKKQTYQNFELIIADDASTDNSVEIIKNEIKDIKEKTKFIELKENKGAAYSRNICLENTTGRFIAFIDSDDIWEPEKLEKQFKFMLKNNYSFTYTSYYFMKKNNNKKLRNLPQSQNYKQAIKNTIIFTSTVMIDTEKIPKKLIEMPDIKGEDAATWWKILRNGYEANGLRELLTYYRVGHESLSANKFKAMNRTWNLYRKMEKMNFLKASYYFCFYVYYATKKRIF